MSLDLGSMLGGEARYVRGAPPGIFPSFADQIRRGARRGCDDGINCILLIEFHLQTDTNMP